MIRKNAIYLILAIVLALTILAGLPPASAADRGPISSNHSSILADDLPTPTPTLDAGTDSNPSGGGNGGG